MAVFPELVMAKMFLVGEPPEVWRRVREVTSLVGAMVLEVSVTAASLKTQSLQALEPLEETQDRTPLPLFCKSVLDPPCAVGRVRV